MGWIKDLLGELGVRPSKGRGQNFLQSIHDAQRLVSAAKIISSDNVLEIGPGLGALTEVLLNKTDQITCVEIEPIFVQYLSKKLSDKKFLRFIQDDFRKVNICDYFSKTKVKVVSNLPYVFSTEAVLWLINNISSVELAVLLVQKEFAERLAAQPNNRTYGSISVHAQFFFDITLGCEVSGDSFYPKANVPSQQIILSPRQSNFKLDCPLEFFESVVRASFSMRRKKLVNCISEKFSMISKDEVADLLTKLKINPLIRAENLSVLDFCNLSSLIYSLLAISDLAHE